MINPMFGVPKAPQKKDLATAAIVFIEKYKAYNQITATESLTCEQVDGILAGVKQFIYQHEELRP